MKVSHVLAAIAVVALVVGHRPAEGCECVALGDGPPALDGYSTIVLATVRSIQDADGRGESRRRVLLSADRVWKGPRVPELSVETGLGGPDCGYVFEVGKRYVVAAGKCQTRRKVPCVDRCGITAREEASAALIERLDRELQGVTVTGSR